MPIISARDKIKIVDQRETNKKRQKRTIGKQVIVIGWES